MAKTIHMKPDVKLFWMDAETTGLDPLKQEMTQVAAIMEVNGAVVDELNVFMRPSRPICIQDQALQVQGKTRQQVMAYPLRKIGFGKLTAFLDKWCNKLDADDKLLWSGQNPEFDISFAREEFKVHGNGFFKAYFGYHKLDLITVAVMMRHLGLFAPKNFKLTTMAETLGIEYNAHDALADIKTTRQIWCIFLDKLKSQGGPRKQLSFL